MSTILVIEDSDGQRAEIRAALEAARLFDDILEARDGIEGLKLLLGATPDLVLCDLEMPGLDGEKLLRMSQSTTRDGSPVPFLVLTAVMNPDRQARLLEQGASDAITKPFHTCDLIARIGLHLKLVEAQRELIAKNAELVRISRTDALTGLPNRRAIDERLVEEFQRSVRYRVPFAVVIADIDRFKRTNDEFGHAAGDRVLVEVAAQFAAVVRETDVGGRYGGEEYLAVLGSNDVDGAQVFAERFRASVEATPTQIASGEKIETTVSLGIAEWFPSDESVEAVVERADDALYRAKESGRNRVCVSEVADPDLATPSRRTTLREESPIPA